MEVVGTMVCNGDAALAPVFLSEDEDDDGDEPSLLPEDEEEDEAELSFESFVSAFLLLMVLPSGCSKNTLA